MTGPHLGPDGLLHPGCHVVGPEVVVGHERHDGVVTEDQQLPVRTVEPPPVPGATPAGQGVVGVTGACLPDRPARVQALSRTATPAAAASRRPRTSPTAAARARMAV